MWICNSNFLKLSSINTSAHGGCCNKIYTNICKTQNWHARLFDKNIKKLPRIKCVWIKGGDGYFLFYFIDDE